MRMSIRDFPIRRKIILMAMATAGLALLLAGAGILFLDSYLFRQYLERDLGTLATITAENSTAALSFEDPKAASENLHALRARQHLEAACIYRINRTVLAKYGRPGAEGACPPAESRDGAVIQSGVLQVSRSVTLGGKVIGWVTMRYDMGETGERARLYGVTVFLVLLLAGAIAFLLASRLRALIVNPVSRLANATAIVSRTGDYSIRAEKFSNDELGVLADAFNEMLSKIQTRDLELLQALLAREQALKESGAARAELAQSNENLARSNEDLERFAFVASHDLQEPLRMITLFSQLLIRTCPADGDEASGYVRNIVNSARRMRTLLSDLLAYTDIGTAAGHEPLPVDLNEILGHVRENLRASIEETGAVVEIGRLPSIRAYEAHFISLFQNLIGNAIKYRGGKIPRICVTSEARNGDLLFSVRDNGIGIAPEYHAKIFVAFKRLHGQNIAGTGIGLAICQRVVDRYRGRIWVESQAGEGAAFYFTLPTALLAEEEAEKA